MDCNENTEMRVLMDFPNQEETPVDSVNIVWDYNMRRHMQEIVPGLYLGPYASAMKSKLDELLNTGITDIICIRQSIEANFIKPNFPQQFRYLVLEMADSPAENIIRFFKETKEFIDRSLINGGKVLVHGNGGISRSAAVVIAYVMESRYMSFEQAKDCVRDRRFCISLNHGFLHQLKEYEHIYRAQSQISSYTTSQVGKRKRYDMETEEEI